MAVDVNKLTKTVKTALMVGLVNLPPTEDGTEIQDIVGSGEDAFDKYPVIRVVPNGINRTISQDTRYRNYEMVYVISIYLDMGDTTIPDAQIIDTMTEIVDSVIQRLDFTDWIPEDIMGLRLTENSITSIIDTTPSKTGTALYCDILYPVSYRTAVE